MSDTKRELSVGLWETPKGHLKGKISEEAQAQLNQINFEDGGQFFIQYNSEDWIAQNEKRPVAYLKYRSKDEVEALKARFSKGSNNSF